MGPDWVGGVTCARIDSVLSVEAPIGQPPFGIGHDRQGDVNIVTSLSDQHLSTGFESAGRKMHGNYVITLPALPPPPPCFIQRNKLD